MALLSGGSVILLSKKTFEPPEIDMNEIEDDEVKRVSDLFHRKSCVFHGCVFLKWVLCSV